MPWLLLLIPVIAGAFAIKKNRDAAAAAAAPPAPGTPTTALTIDAATVAAAAAGVPAAVAMQQQVLANQIAAGQADQPQIEFPANSPQQDAQNAAQAAADQAAQSGMTVAQADAQLQGALAGGPIGSGVPSVTHPAEPLPYAHVTVGPVAGKPSLQARMMATPQAKPKPVLSAPTPRPTIGKVVKWGG